MSPTSKILIVDDIPSNIQVLSLILKDEHEVYFATNGEKAVELARSKLPDLVLLDIMMPGMDGYEVCRKLKADPLTEDIPVIFITARSEVEDETHGLEVGAIDFITKPVSPPIVKARVRNHIQLKRHADLLKRMSFMDGLTGIANRRHFDDMLDKSWRRCERLALPMSLVMLDVDHFKLYNDHYGHQGGDDCLKAVAACMAASVARPDDLAARFGGEEFVCLLPSTDAAGAAEVARQVMEGVRALEIPHAVSPVAPFVTISLGVATLSPAQDGRAADGLIARADERLYEAKRAGRNRIVAG